MQRIRTTVLAMIVIAGVYQAHAEAGKDVHKESKDSYPLKTCVVSGEALGDMGDPYKFNYKGEEIQFCCEGCKKDFLKEPEKFLAKLKKAKAAKSMKGEGHGEHGSQKVADSDQGAQPEGDGGHGQHSGHGH